MNLIHVRSHENLGKKFNDLSLPVQMNTMADQLAKEQTKHGTYPPELYVPFSYLKIKGNHITRDSQATSADGRGVQDSNSAIL
jgi:hypothetical protein